MRKLLGVTFLFSILLVFPSSVSAQVLINEFSSNSDTEWVELYNTTSSAIDLSGWGLQDEAQPVKVLTGSIPAAGYFVFENPSGWLNNSGGDTITLKDLGSVVIDSVHYGTGGVVSIPDSDKSAGRVGNGSSNWQNNISWTKGSANPDPTTPPSPSPTPTPTPAPTQSPLPTPTPTKSPTSPPTKSPTPKPSKTPIASPEVFGEEVSPTPKAETPSPPPLLSDSKEKRVPIIPIVLIVSGLAMIGFAILQLVNAKKHTPET